MDLIYTKISRNLYKFFYEGKGYGEFYLRFEDATRVNGKASLDYKDKDYGPALLAGLTEELTDNGADDLGKKIVRLQKLIGEHDCKLTPEDACECIPWTNELHDLIIQFNQERMAEASNND